MGGYPLVIKENPLEFTGENIMLTIIIINYKDEDRTIRFVKEEVSKITTPHAVIIVNNGSTTESSQNLHSELTSCVIIDSTENLGFAKGNNLGAEYAKKNIFRSIGTEDFLLFSNSDIKFNDNNVAEALIDRISSLPYTAVIGPKIIGLDGRLQSPFPFQTFMDRHFWIYWGNLFMNKKKKAERLGLDYSEHAQEGYHYWVSGSFFLMRAKDFYDCGEMDPATFLYCEEPILSERLKKIGRKVYYYPAVSVIHEHGVTTTKTHNRQNLRKYTLQSEFYYYKKYIGTPQWQIALAKFTYWLKGLLGRL